LPKTFPGAFGNEKQIAHLESSVYELLDEVRELKGGSKPKLKLNQNLINKNIQKL